MDSLFSFSYLWVVWAGSVQQPCSSWRGFPSWWPPPCSVPGTRPGLSSAAGTSWRSRWRNSSQTLTPWTYTREWSVPEWVGGGGCKKGVLGQTAKEKVTRKGNEVNMAKGEAWSCEKSPVPGWCLSFKTCSINPAFHQSACSFSHFLCRVSQNKLHQLRTADICISLFLCLHGN